MALKSFSSKTPTCIIDLSYYLHLRCNSTVKWYVNTFGSELYIDNDNLYNYDFLSDDDFINAFEYSFRNGLFNFISTNGCYPNKTILAKDCKRSNIWRKRIYPEYKANRDKKKNLKYPNIGPMFSYAYDFLIPKILEESSIVMVGAEYAEGDDVIAVLSEHIVNNSDDDIIVMATDMDLCQIINKNISIIDYRGNSINEKCNTRYGSPKRMLYAKMLQGDRGDNIPNICRGMGEKTALKCVDDKELLKEKMLKHPESPKQLKLNRVLVDFKYIPNKLKSTIIQNYDNVIES